MIRHDWLIEDVEAIYATPLLDLLFKAQSVHREHSPSKTIDTCNLLSIKTGGCPEDCSFCSQSSHHSLNGNEHELLPEAAVFERAQAVMQTGGTRLCLAAAWRSPVEARGDFDRVLSIVKKISDLGLEPCCTLGSLDLAQAMKLKAAGCVEYNHNLDTSPEYFAKITTTRCYDKRLATIKNVRTAGLRVCCGGIIGMGESLTDRFVFLQQLAALDPHPEAVPLNLFKPEPGTPLEHLSTLDPFEFIRTVATGRIMLPKARICLGTGCNRLNDQALALCFLAGARALFRGPALIDEPWIDCSHPLLGQLNQESRQHPFKNRSNSFE